ncbi:MAG: ABC transporter ATP-binding protein [Planctomycetota bacterium]
MTLQPVGSDSKSTSVEIRNLSRTFGSKKALDDVSLTVPSGTVFGIVGENGAGKTTLLRHILGSLRPQRGSVRVLGMNPITDLHNVLSRLGYLSASPELPGWMRVEQLIAYTRPFYPTWDDAYAAELVEMFDIHGRAKVKTLSTGQGARVGLLLALAHRPELLILDEPSSGLDPVVRRDILEAIIESISRAGSTVVFSSHLLDEVERVSEYVAMVQKGRLLECESLEAMKGSFRGLTLSFEQPLSQSPSYPEAIHWHGGGREWTCMCRNVPADVTEQVTMIGGQIVEERVPSLDEIFLAYASGSAPRSIGTIP